MEKSRSNILNLLDTLNTELGDQMSKIKVHQEKIKKLNAQKKDTKKAEENAAKQANASMQKA